jgi:rare lipoprotein A
LKLLLILLGVLLAAGCGSKRRPAAKLPPPPSPATEAPSTAGARQTAEPRLEASAAEPAGPPIHVEQGLASWYGAAYHNRRAANGEVYDMHALTAAHRTLPLNSLVRVVNPKTGSSVVVRITDRGPFVQGRVIDLSLAAAKAVEVWRPGVAPVRLEVLKTPAPLEHGGRWAVQIGGFGEEKDARRLQDRLSRRYRTANVLAFPSPVGPWWVRVRVLNDDRTRAEEVARVAPTDQERVFLVRLD